MHWRNLCPTLCCTCAVTAVLSRCCFHRMDAAAARADLPLSPSLQGGYCPANHLCCVRHEPQRPFHVSTPPTCAALEKQFTSLQAQLPSLLHALGVPRRALAQQHRPDELVLLREITAEQGLLRSRCYVNGVATSLRVLREIGIALVDVNGQHAAQTVR